MTAASPPPVWTPPPPNRWGVGRVLALVFGIVLLFPALGLLLGGGLLLAADRAARTSDGYVMSDTDGFRTDGFALTTERIDLSTGADWLPVSSALGTARIEVTGSDRDVFVGIAPAADAAPYLAGVQRSVVDDLGGVTTQRNIDGGPPSTPPGDQNFWAAQAEGAGTQQLSWQPAQGDWVLVIMNADGSAGMSVTAAVGATVPSLGGLAWGLLIGGVVLALLAALLLVLAFRRPARAPAWPPSGTPYPAPTGPAPGWAPPAPRPPSAEEEVRPDPARQAPSDDR